MSAVAIRKGQSREKAEGLQEMGTVRCDSCSTALPNFLALPDWQRY